MRHRDILASNFEGGGVMNDFDKELLKKVAMKLVMEEFAKSAQYYPAPPVIYTTPKQKKPNYVIPSIAALTAGGLVLAKNWNKIKPGIDRFRQDPSISAFARTLKSGLKSVVSGVGKLFKR